MHGDIRPNMSTLECPVFIKYYPNLPKDCEYSQYCESIPARPQPKPFVVPKIKKGISLLNLSEREFNKLDSVGRRFSMLDIDSDETKKESQNKIELASVAKRISSLEFE